MEGQGTPDQSQAGPGEPTRDIPSSPYGRLLSAMSVLLVVIYLLHQPQQPVNSPKQHDAMRIHTPLGVWRECVRRLRLLKLKNNTCNLKP